MASNVADPKGPRAATSRAFHFFPAAAKDLRCATKSWGSSFALPLGQVVASALLANACLQQRLKPGADSLCGCEPSTPTWYLKHRDRQSAGLSCLCQRPGRRVAKEPGCLSRAKQRASRKIGIQLSMRLAVDRHGRSTSLRSGELDRALSGLRLSRRPCLPEPATSAGCAQVLEK